MESLIAAEGQPRPSDPTKRGKTRTSAQRRPQGAPARLRSLAVIAAFSLGVMSLGVSPAMASHVSCGDTITTDTTLDSNLVNCPGDGIVIGADDITLDLNGHTIDGDGIDQDFDLGIDNSGGHDGVTIQGGSIREFVDGVFIEDARDNIVRNLSTSHHLHGGIGVVECNNVRVAKVNAFSNIAGIVLARVSDTIVVHNTVSRNELGGIPVFESDHLLIAENSVSGSGESGIVLFDSERNRVQRNRTAGNEVGVHLESSNHNRIVRNRATGSEFVGVLVERSDDNVLRQNSLVRNPDGMIVFEANRNAIRGNRIVGCARCGGPGISMEVGKHNLIARNRIRRTVGDGIRIGAFDPGVTTVDTVVRANRVRHVGGDGISVATEGSGIVRRTLLKGNRVIGSGDDGIDVERRATTITRNIANRNHDLGIEAVRGVNDGGGNIARHNGDPRQCAHLSCG